MWPTPAGSWWPLLAALGRDRADRGLDVARARAEKDALPAPAEPDVDVDRGWVTVAELDAAARRIERELLAALRSVPMATPVVADDERQERAGRLAAEAATARAAAHRAEIARLAAGRDGLAEAAVTDYLAAREAARVMDAGAVEMSSPFGPTVMV
jgi:hypothetical protein